MASRKRDLERSLVELGAANRPSQPAPPPGACIELDKTVTLDLELEPGEPAFVLRASDLMASDFVRQWAAKAQDFGVPRDKIRAALRCATSMDEWRLRKGLKK